MMTSTTESFQETSESERESCYQRTRIRDCFSKRNVAGVYRLSSWKNVVIRLMAVQSMKRKAEPFAFLICSSTTTRNGLFAMFATLHADIKS